MTSRPPQLPGASRFWTAPSDDPIKVFCGHCGCQPDRSANDVQSRVCTSCGMGLLLHASSVVAPTSTDPFLVVDGSLAVCALSGRAERLLGVSETETVNKHVSELLVPADAGATKDALATSLMWAARGDAFPQNLVVRPTNAFGVRYWARIGQCGPSPAALVVLATAG